MVGAVISIRNVGGKRGGREEGGSFMGAGNFSHPF